MVWQKGSPISYPLQHLDSFKMDNRVCNLLDSRWLKVVFHLECVPHSVNVVLSRGHGVPLGGVRVACGGLSGFGKAGSIQLVSIHFHETLHGRTLIFYLSWVSFTELHFYVGKITLWARASRCWWWTFCQRMTWWALTPRSLRRCTECRHHGRPPCPQSHPEGWRWSTGHGTRSCIRRSSPGDCQEVWSLLKRLLGLLSFGILGEIEYWPNQTHKNEHIVQSDFPWFKGTVNCLKKQK